ncbi:hypothetical protein HYH03_009371 [Edaphochlamys debaryana]|uniref:Uncharacterized protein n=1 Tax=Edaphochlamys debaryana TaxID=47281 RepID=A0A835Y0K7_9CHLO|nr:hypothetical protein HYH03_009371 [Edaphochlamys debaryana]|eukprot:KAG2492428.1 hypothetical protein HYH03_009371 [Edaphochlamys debaryana]
MAWVELLTSGGTKRTLSELLRKLPQHGVGALVTRDTWHPAGNKYWQVVEVVPQPGDPTKLQAFGVKYYKGERVTPVPKRIASVWKYGWMLRALPSHPNMDAQALAARRAAAAASAVTASPAAAAAAAAEPAKAAS